MIGRGGDLLTVLVAVFLADAFLVSSIIFFIGFFVVSGLVKEL